MCFFCSWTCYLVTIRLPKTNQRCSGMKVSEKNIGIKTRVQKTLEMMSCKHFERFKDFKPSIPLKTGEIPDEKSVQFAVTMFPAGDFETIALAGREIAPALDRGAYSMQWCARYVIIGAH